MHTLKPWRKRKKKRKNCQYLPRSAAGTFGLISFFPVEKPEILSSGFFVFKVNHRRDYRTCRFERTVLLYGQLWIIKTSNYGQDVWITLPKAAQNVALAEFNRPGLWDIGIVLFDSVFYFQRHSLVSAGLHVVYYAGNGGVTAYPGFILSRDENSQFLLKPE